MADINKEILVLIRTEFENKKLKNGMGSLTKTVEESRKNIGKGMERITKIYKTNGAEVRKVVSEVKKGIPIFQGWALSFMFAGMIIKRAFETIMKASVATFMKITEGQTTASRAVVRLSAAFEFLKYSIGKAFATLIENNPWIAQLVDWFSRLIQDNPTLAAGFILTAIAVGLFLMTVGQLVLFLSAIPGAIAAVREGLATLNSINAVFSEAGLGSVWTFLGALFLVALGAWIAFKSLTENTATFEEKWGGAFIGAGLAAVGFAVWFANPVGMIIALILLIVGTIILYKNQIIFFFKELALMAPGLWNKMWSFILDILGKAVKGINKVLGRFSPFKGMTDALEAGVIAFSNTASEYEKQYKDLLKTEEEFNKEHGNPTTKLIDILLGKGGSKTPEPTPAPGTAPSVLPATVGATAPTTPAEFGANFARDLQLGKGEFDKGIVSSTIINNNIINIDSLNLERGAGESNEDFHRRLMEESQRRFGPIVNTFAPKTTSS